MPVWGILSLIFQAVRYLPTLIKLIREVLDLIKSLNGRHEHSSKEILLELTAALKLAKESGDLSGIQVLQDKLAKTIVEKPPEPTEKIEKRKIDQSWGGDFEIKRDR